MSSVEENQNQDGAVGANGWLNQLTSTFLNIGSNGNDYTRFATIAGAALVGGALYYYMNSNRPKKCKGIDYSNQSREINVR
jgi:hypothetical protein